VSREGHRAFSPKTQGRLGSSLCVYRYTQGREGAIVKPSSSKVTKPVSVGTGTRTKSPARQSLLPALILPAVDERKTHNSNRLFFAVKSTLVFWKKSHKYELCANYL